MTKEKRWHNQIAKYVEKYGPVAGLPAHPIQHHHVVGRKTKQRLPHPRSCESILIGPWFVIPLPFHLHDVSSDHPNNVTHHEKNFVKAFGSQRALWWNMCRDIMAMDTDGSPFEPDQIGDLPFNSDVVEAIRATSK